MLQHTFCHVPGIGAKTEEKIWDSGVLAWSDFKEPYPSGFPQNKIRILENHLCQSIEQIDSNNPGYFTKRLPADQVWRLFPDFRDRVAYIDIETTGLEYENMITTIALYDGLSIKWYVNGENLEEFQDDILEYSVIITYNGKCFDVPFIEKFFRIKMNHAHVDLRYVLSGLGFKGGLKGCEIAMGIDRGDVKGIDGYFAVLLWNDYIKKSNRKALETLLAYNIEDVVNLEKLMVMAFNMKLAHTPFNKTHKIEDPKSPEIPFRVDMDTVERIKRTSTFVHF